MTREDDMLTAAAPATRNGEDEAEQARLDDAIRRADELLADSLRRDEAQLRRRRRRGWLALGIAGGVVVTVAMVFVVMFAVASGGKADAPAKPQAAEAERAKTLAVEGWRLWAQQKPAEAEMKFAESVKLDPTSPHAWNGFGWSLMNQGKHKDALERFKRAVEIDPQHAGASNGLGHAYLALGKLDDAERPLLVAAAHDASPAWGALARIYLLRGDYDRALPWTLLILRDSPADETTQAMLQAVRKRELDEKLRKQIEPAGG